MRTLILSCSTGGGHNTCAEAIKEVYDRNNDHCEIKEALDFVGWLLTNIVCNGHIYLYRHTPVIFNSIYTMFEAHPNRMGEKSLIYNLLSKGADKLYRYITENKFDAVICTHVFAGLMLTEVKSRYDLPIKTGFVTTDYTCYPGVKNLKLDLYFIPDDKLFKEFESVNINQDNTIAPGIPIRQMFYLRHEKHYAKKRFGIPYGHKHLLIMCGSMGCGKIAKAAGYIGKRLPLDCDVTVICGTNTKLKRRLSKQFECHKNIHIRGYVNDISLAIDSADVCLTKPGGITVTELMVKHMPMALMNTVSGCEKHNSTWLISNGCALSDTNVRDVCERTLALLKNDLERERIKTAIFKQTSGNSAQIIYSAMKGVYHEATCY